MPRRGRSILGLLMRGVICLIAGAVVTIGVAWGLAISASNDNRPLMPRNDPQIIADSFIAADVRYQQSAIGRARLMAAPFPREEIVGPIVDHSSVVHFSEASTPPWVRAVLSEHLFTGQPLDSRRIVGRLLTEAYGWPALAVYDGEESGMVLRPIPALSWPPPRRPRGRFPAPKFVDPLISPAFDDAIKPYGLPAGPIWRGLIINTLFYAALCWPLTLVPGWIRAIRRRRRGACVGCGYLLHPTATMCSECGRPTRHRGRSEATAG